MNKEFKYILPDENGKRVEHSTNNNSLIIIGANGSGKSKLGAWMERSDIENTHRVGAQRSLNFEEFISLKSHEQAQNLLFYGQEKQENTKGGRWGYNRNKKDTTQLLNDYEYALSSIIARKNNQNDEYLEECKEKDSTREQHDKVPETVVDILKRIWQNIFSQRDIDFADSKVTAILRNGNEDDISYRGNEMSDGERVGLYLIAQCLSVPLNKTIIIDEPEIHLHRSIMNRLWNEIEKARKDCFFIYITHDTQFASGHRNSDKVWVKNYDGKKWKLEKLTDNSNGLPEQLLLDILGNRKKVLFVEGESDSYDTKLYSEIYKDYYVVPCGSCTEVINRTKAMKRTPLLHHLDCYGIIDRDFRSDGEITALKNHNIYTLQVAEVENLFLVEELLEVVKQILNPGDNDKVEKIKKSIIEKRFANQKNKQICEAVVSELKYELSVIDISSKNEDEVKQKLGEAYEAISYDSVRENIEEKFNNANSYKEILKVF
ncbi:MAG: DUF4435 domain-containing protein, partial [Tetragenococcus halophilus]|nr:DUF4435 domain-containing protein [Tetragenococcus halophilus]